MKLYELHPSRSSRCRWLLQELGLKFESVEVDLGNVPHGYESKHPLKLVPAFEDNGLVLFESLAICNYLSEKYPEKNMIPKSGTKARAFYDQWMFYLANELEGPLWEGEGHRWRFPESERSEIRLERAQKQFKEAASVVNKALEGKKFLVEGQFSTADIVLGHISYWAKKRSLIGNFENLESHLKMMMELPSCPFD